MNQRRSVESLPCQMTAQETILKGKELAEVASEIEAIEAEKKLSASELKKRRERTDARVRELAREVRSGVEYRPIECFEVPRYSTQMVDLVRSDTHHVVRSRAMDPSERQTHLDLGQDSEPSETGH